MNSWCEFRYCFFFQDLPYKLAFDPGIWSRRRTGCFKESTRTRACNIKTSLGHKFSLYSLLFWIMNHLTANTFVLSLQLLVFEFIIYMGKNTFKFFINLIERKHVICEVLQVETLPSWRPSPKLATNGLGATPTFTLMVSEEDGISVMETKVSWPL